MTDHDTNGANPKDSLEARIASALEANCAELDPQVRRRLDRIRAEALARASAEPPVRRFWGPRWQPMAAGAVAAAIALALAVVLIDQSPEINPPPITADLDLLTDPQFELFVEDPEFVAWIAEAEPENQSAENSG